MARHIDAAESAKIIRKVLKKEYPNTKFSVRISRYSGGSSIYVRWTDGAAYKDVKNTLNPFFGKRFDGMTDMEEYIYAEWEGEEICFGQYLNLDRDTSRAFIDRVYAYCQDRFTNLAERVKIVGSETDSRFDVDNYGRDMGLLGEFANIVNSSHSDRIFDWETENKEKRAREQFEREAIAKR